MRKIDQIYSNADGSGSHATVRNESNLKVVETRNGKRLVTIVSITENESPCNTVNSEIDILAHL